MGIVLCRCSIVNLRTHPDPPQVLRVDGTADSVEKFLYHHLTGFSDGMADELHEVQV